MLHHPSQPRSFSFSLSVSLMLLFLLVMGCGAKSPGRGGSSSPSFKLYGDIGVEKSYCSNVVSPSPATSLTASARFSYRLVDNSAGLTTPQIGNIRFAEVQVLDSNGTVIQCGETDSAGNISINVPQKPGTFTLKVLSRADNPSLKASILNNPTAMEPYSVSASLTLDGSETSKTVSLPVADYTGTLEGGAFNILDQIYLANEYIRTHSSCSVCTLFTVAPKVRVFWQPGLSPGAYYEAPTASISFYTATDDTSYGMASGIYMMGGIKGDLCVDTDHFDNSVIIHEYGHFLENALAASDSPGGSHNGNSVIDPRLAWSEGWSNFLQGAVRGESRYVDTKGNSDCSGGTGINVDLNLETITPGQDAVNINTYLGEGIFREVSVSRALWDMMEPNTVGDLKGADLGFPYIWKVFSDPVSGFRSSNIRFRNIGHFNELMRSLVNTNEPAKLTNYDDVISNERQISTRREYAYPVSAKASSCSFSLKGIAGVNHLAKTQDFFSYYFDGAAAHATLTLKYSASSGTPSDLDLYVWNEKHSLGNTADRAGNSARYYPESGAQGVEVVSLLGRPAGYYLIQVAADPERANASSDYFIETDSGAKRLCP